MRTETVEIYSDQSNIAVMRNPERRFPGVLIQGDGLYALCREADEACDSIGRNGPGFSQTNALRNSLWRYLNHYRAVLSEHGLSLPFSEQSF